MGFLLIIPHPSLPAICAQHLKDFLERGGSVLTIGGVLFRKYVEKVDGVLKIYLEDGQVLSPLLGTGNNDSNFEGIPQSDAYANEINYFTECVKNNTDPKIICSKELETVLNILNSI